MDYSAASPDAITAPDKLLTPKEAAQYLGLSKRTLARYVKAGQIKPSRLNARVLRFKKMDLDTFIAGDANPAHSNCTQGPALLRPTGCPP
jgi:excisionase family DNA binding protein